MMAPLSIIDYIVVHELCHFHHIDHSEAFWNEVDKILPDYRERKEWLRRHGARLSLGTDAMIPEKPTSRLQKYQTTKKGVEAIHGIRKPLR